MQFKNYWALIKKSLKGGDIDFTEGPLKEAVFLLALPMILELGMESVFAVVDIYFVSKLGSAAIATVGLTESVITIVYSMAIGLSTAATAIVARRIGEKNREAASRAAGQAISLSVLITLALSALGVIFASDILSLMGAEPEVVSSGTGFTRIMFGSSITIVLLFLINGIFRGAGNAAMAMKSLWLASIINIILDPIFISWYGVEGAAIATSIGRGTGVIYQLYHLTGGRGKIELALSYFRLKKEQALNIIKVAWPATLQFLIASGSWIILAKIVAETGGTDATAGYQIALRNFIFFLLPAWGLSNAAATLVGQSLGAQKPERAEESVKLTAKYNATFMFFVMILFVFFPSEIMSFYTNDILVIEHGAIAMRIVGYGYVFYGVGMVLLQAINGSGDTRTPTWMNLVGFWLVQVPLAYLLSVYTPLAEIGAYIAIPVAEVLLTLMAAYVFYRGKWKTVEV